MYSVCSRVRPCVCVCVCEVVNNVCMHVVQHVCSHLSLNATASCNEVWSEACALSLATSGTAIGIVDDSFWAMRPPHFVTDNPSLCFLSLRIDPGSLDLVTSCFAERAGARCPPMLLFRSLHIPRSSSGATKISPELWCCLLPTAQCP